MIIFAIETSCDETAVAVIKNNGKNLVILSEAVSSQIKLHADWGGVVPNLAAREHLKNIIPLIEYSMRKAKVGPREIDLIATTKGPGLIPALLIGNNVAKTLAWTWKKPWLGINHIEGHIYANFVGVSSKFKVRSSKPIKFPVLCLIVSGGHTQLVLMKDHLRYKIIGQTLDDAAGEAFDKVARILGIGYPGGPAVAAEAAKFQVPSLKFRVSLPRPMIKSKDFNFSFSGLKTAVLYAVKKNEKLLKNKTFICEMCHEFQQSVIDVLISKTVAASKKFNPRTVMIAGGVSANKELRHQLKIALRKNFPDIAYREPNALYSVDNAVMIAGAAHYRWRRMTPRQKKASLNSWKKNEADANLKLT